MEVEALFDKEVSFRLYLRNSSSIEYALTNVSHTKNEKLAEEKGEKAKLFGTLPRRKGKK